MTSPCCRRRWTIAVILLILGGLAVLSPAVYTLLFYRGSSMALAPGDVRLLSDRVSNFFCQTERIQLTTSDKSIHFNASVLPGDKLNDKIKQTVQLDVSPVLEAVHGRAFWRFFLPAGSLIKVEQCTTDASGKSVMSFIFKGHDVDEDCIKHVSAKRSSGGDNGSASYFDKSCTDIILRRYLVRHCGGSKQGMSATTTLDDYYLVLYDSISPTAAQVNASISLTRLTYDRRSSLANCSSSDSCSLPLRFLSSDTVIAQVAVTSLESEVSLEWSCSPRSAFYACLFVALPLVLCALISIIYYCVCVKRHRKMISLSVAAPPINEDDERKPLIENAEVQPSIYVAEQSYNSGVQENRDPLLTKTGPIPGPYQYPPSAPPNVPPELLTPSDDDQPFAFPREPPPTYEESVKIQPGN